MAENVPTAIRGYGDINKCRSLVGFAKQGMEVLKNLMSFNKLDSYSISKKFNDGAVIYLSSVFGVDKIDIVCPVINYILPAEEKSIVDIEVEAAYSYYLIDNFEDVSDVIYGPQGSPYPFHTPDYLDHAIGYFDWGVTGPIISSTDPKFGNTCYSSLARLGWAGQSLYMTTKKGPTYYSSAVIPENDFTYEVWIKDTDIQLPPFGYRYRAWPLIAQGDGSSYILFTFSTTGISLTLYDRVGNFWSVNYSTDILPPFNTWYHFAFIAAKNKIRWAINGRIIDTFTSTVTDPFSDGFTSWQVRSQVSYIDALSICTTAKWRSDFTVPSKAPARQ